jgi:hypothetical protein
MFFACTSAVALCCATVDVEAKEAKSHMLDFLCDGELGEGRNRHVVKG